MNIVLLNIIKEVAVKKEEKKVSTPAASAPVAKTGKLPATVKTEQKMPAKV